MEQALVTGATSGIGLALATQMLKEGMFVHINYAHDEERARDVAGKLAHISPAFCLHRADLSSIEEACRLAQSIEEKHEKLDYIVLNCGATDPAPFGEITQQGWQRVMDTNLTVPLFLLQALYSHMNEGGAVLCIGSMMAEFPHARSIGYGVSKAALNALCQNLVKVLAEKRIRINALEPGFIETAWQKNKPADQRERIENRIALGRFGMPEEVAQMGLAVLRNTYMTGSLVPICGGYDSK